MAEPAPEPILPSLALASFIACVAGAAALANCAVLAALLKRCRNGVLSVILHLAVSDLILLGTTIAPELWSLNLGTWTFGSNGCVAYQGFNVFNSTASSYLIVTATLHTLASARAQEKVSGRRQRCAQNEDEEMKTSQHSLVANSDSSTPPRTMNVDYRFADDGVPVTLPTMFVWILAASLSIPEFVLSSLLRQGKVTICTLDTSHSFNVHSLLLVFNLFLPMFIMSTVSVLITVKLNSKRPYVVDVCESRASLKLALGFVATYFLLCAPRSVVNAYSIFTITNSESSEQSHNFTNNDFTSILGLALSSTYLLGTLVRPFLCIIILPQLRKVFTTK